jgi:hypothetical protein
MKDKYYTVSIIVQSIIVLITIEFESVVNIYASWITCGIKQIIQRIDNWITILCIILRSTAYTMCFESVYIYDNRELYIILCLILHNTAVWIESFSHI